MTTDLVPTKSNPLAKRQMAFVDPLQQLRDHVDKLNNFKWVVASGKLYFVGMRTKADGTIEHFVDRHI